MKKIDEAFLILCKIACGEDFDKDLAREILFKFPLEIRNPNFCLNFIGEDRDIVTLANNDDVVLGKIKYIINAPDLYNKIDKEYYKLFKVDEEESRNRVVESIIDKEEFEIELFNTLKTIRSEIKQINGDLEKLIETYKK